ncbi:MAG TPA: 50S ribosomal protein L28 [Spirochaetota bacterium]|nr:50S ribosomal protein L28 [Spirochaetota bacterium]HOL56205.1 50S ribosomal protein L28 [Spirochaetota bacterium]HPP03822.1 50S ribosomal protein L28 [Spirochaetota bacterium]
MSRRCEFCGRGTAVGMNVPRKGLLKKKGGTGSKIGVRTKRTFKVNLHSKYITLPNGNRKKFRICSRCLKAMNKVS